MDAKLNALMEGAVAGAIATLPMSAVMYAAREKGWMGEYPPEVIARDALETVDIRPNDGVNDAVATVAHLGFGATAGALFGLLHKELDLPLPRLAQGVAYGLLVYAASYDGWIPAMRIMPEPEEDRPGRQPSMIAAHVVYGAVLGALLASRPRS